jgi:hypothetical protein
VELDVPLFDELCGLVSSVFEVLLLLLMAAAVVRGRVLHRRAPLPCGGLGDAAAARLVV